MSSKNRKSIFNSAREIGARFRDDERGNIAVIFAFTLLPILGLVGAAVDYTRVNTARTQLQSALDSASLMVSKDAASLSDADMRQRAWDYFSSLYKNTEAPVTQADLQINYVPNTGKGATLSLSATSKINSDFVQIMGDQFKQLGFGSSSTTSWGGTRLRVAMALDVTGSMNDAGKLAAMQTAANSLVDTLGGLAQNAEDIYISVVPFAQMVNVGASNVSASWIDWSVWDANNGSCNKKDSWGRTINTQSVCLANSGKWTPDSHSTWNGCVTDRQKDPGDYDTKVVPPTNSDTDFPAVQYVQSGKNICPAQILPMTAAYPVNGTGATTIKNKINSLKANGGTNQPIGMVWAWQSLQTGVPLNTPPKDSNYQYTDAIILLSDGLNTIDRWYGNGSDPSPQVDARQTILCNNIKTPDPVTKKRPVVFTIQVNTSGDPELAVLKACADDGNFFPTSTASGIASAFTKIGATLAQLRISQ